VLWGMEFVFELENDMKFKEDQNIWIEDTGF